MLNATKPNLINKLHDIKKTRLVFGLITKKKKKKEFVRPERR